jgi:hypothetical protein
VITKIGTLTVGAAVPSIPLAIAEISALLAPLLADQTKLAAAIANPIILPDVAGYIAALNAAIANAVNALTNLPTATLQLKADLNVQFGILAALVAAANLLISSLSAAVSAGGVSVYAFDGANTMIGSELQAAVSGDFSIPAHANALVLFTADPATWSSLGVLLKTSP